MLKNVLHAFAIPEEEDKAQAFGSGLINHTWKVTTGDRAYILQRINHQVFRQPEAIAYNHGLVASYLATHYPDYLFVKPVKSIHQQDIFQDGDEGFFRLSPFVPGSHTIDVVGDPQQAFEAALQFGKFTKLLVHFDATLLKTTLPDFHNLALRYSQFEKALHDGNPARIAESGSLIEAIHASRDIVDTYNNITKNSAFRLRATHHDTKISNVLFDNADRGLCVIDLDTLMPGYFISDLGDMMRTYLSPVSEEEQDLELISIREPYFQAIVQGYLGQLNQELSAEEKAHFTYAGKFMIYMQAIRFLTDHLLEDVYYGARYEGHNYNRAANQLMLLKCLLQKESALQAIVDRF